MREEKRNRAFWADQHIKQKLTKNSDKMIKIFTFTLAAWKQHRSLTSQASHASFSQNTGLYLWPNFCTQYSLFKRLSTSFCLFILTNKMGLLAYILVCVRSAFEPEFKNFPPSLINKLFINEKVRGPRILSVMFSMCDERKRAFSFRILASPNPKKNFNKTFFSLLSLSLFLRTCYLLHQASVCKITQHFCKGNEQLHLKEQNNANALSYYE